VFETLEYSNIRINHDVSETLEYPNIRRYILQCVVDFFVGVNSGFERNTEVWDNFDDLGRNFEDIKR